MIFDPYRKAKTPKVPAAHVALLKKTAIAEGVVLIDDPIQYSYDDATTYRVAVVREDNSVNYLWLPARTFNNPELLAGAIRPWRHDPVERAAFEARLAVARGAQTQKAPTVEPTGSTLGEREAKRLERLKRA